MKRIGFLYDEIISMDNLIEAFKDARKSKRNKRQVMQFEARLGAELSKLHEELKNKTYRPKPYSVFTVYEPKKRTIFAPHFRDVVVQHAIYRKIYDLFDRSFINTSFACRKNHGTHKASSYTQYALRQHDDQKWILKLDIRKFFYSIDRDVLKKQMERKIKDRALIDLLMLFCEYGEPKGIPIGNLLSQMFALIYLSPLDRFVKNNLRVKHYVRYVDDFVLFGLEKVEALDCLRLIKNYLKEELHLELSKHSLQRIKRGCNFVGYRTYQNNRIIRKRSLCLASKAIVRFDFVRLSSYIGHALRTSSARFICEKMELLIASTMVLNAMPCFTF